MALITFQTAKPDKEAIEIKTKGDQGSQTLIDIIQSLQLHQCIE